MITTRTTIGIVSYPGALQSAVHGLGEMFTLANNLCQQYDQAQHLSTEVLSLDDIVQTMHQKQFAYTAIIIPPSISSEFYLNPTQALRSWLLECHAKGTTLCSACAGTFVLASTGLLTKRMATTHWGLAEIFAKTYPDVVVDIEKILINDGDIITAGGLMSWVDLGLELVAQYTSTNIMRLLGKQLVVDTGLREQRYYQSFSPRRDHGDKEILKVQQYLQVNFNQHITVAELCEICFLSGRTFLRRFVKATRLKPVQYLQRLRIQKACDLIESTNDTFEVVSHKVGYEDISSFRKVFIKIIGLTPRDFKNRFASDQAIEL